jgi:hypothetical protein
VEAATQATRRPRAGGPKRRVVATAIVAAAALAAVLLAPSAGARTAANLSIDVSFFTNGTITVTLPSGSPVGTTAGSPTVIPAGYYAVLESGPGGCTSLPHFVLTGPGENIVDNLTEGEVTNFQYNAYFQPNSTYTWKDDANPGVVYTFATSGDIQGSAPAVPGHAGIQASTHGTAQSQDVLGSAVATSRGTLAGAVSASGALTLSFKGKPAATLAAGKYTLKVTDASKKSGFMLVKAKQKVTVTGMAYVGKRTATVTLTAGRWSLETAPGGNATAITVK